MALPSPNLDDRRFQHFVDDAKRYIQRRAPEWTDHNVSDPGVTLVETVAHMADQIVYRLNRIPEKNHLAFLDLVGITLFPPSAARTDVTFWLSAPQDDPVRVPVGTETATLRADSEDAVVFATERELTVIPSELRHLAVQHSGDQVTDRTTDLVEGTDLMCFAESPAPGDCMLLGLSAAVPHCAVALRLDSRVDGVGVDPRQPPLVWEAWTAEGWVAGGGRIGVVVGGDDVEREDEIARVVGAADDVADVDVEHPLLVARGHLHLAHLDTGLPAVQGGEDLVLDAARGGLVDRSEDQVVDGAAEFGAHGPLARGGREHEPDGLLDLPLAADQGDAPGRADTQREGPAGADELPGHQTTTGMWPLIVARPVSATDVPPMVTMESTVQVPVE